MLQVSSSDNGGDDSESTGGAFLELSKDSEDLDLYSADSHHGAARAAFMEAYSGDNSEDTTEASFTQQYDSTTSTEGDV